MSDLPISSPYRSRPDEPVTEEERNRLNRRLTDAFSAGTLDEDDYNRRLDLLWSAKRLGELVPVVTGLPPAPTYDQPAIVTGSQGTPGTLAPTRSGVPMTLMLGGGVAVIVLLVVIIVLVLAL